LPTALCDGALRAIAFFHTADKLQRGTGTNVLLAQSKKSNRHQLDALGVAMMRNSHLKSRRAAPSGWFGSRLPRDGEMKRRSMSP